MPEKTKSLDELLAKKKTKTTKTSDDDLRNKMNRQVAASKILDSDKKADNNVDLESLNEELSKIQIDLDVANKKLKALYNLKYNEQKIIDKSKNNISQTFLKSLCNANELLEKEREEKEKLNAKKEALEKEIKKLKELKTNANDASEIKKELKEYKTNCTKALNNLEKLKLRHQEELKEYKDKLNENKKEINKLNAKIEKAKSSNDEKTNKEITKLQTKLKESEKKYKALEKEYNALNDNKQNEELDNRLEELNKEIVLKDEKIKELENNIELLQNNSLNKDDVNSLYDDTLNKYHELIVNEQKIREDNEKVLLDTIDALKKTIEDNNNTYSKYSYSYMYAAISSQVDAINNILNNIKINGVKLTSDVYYKYYNKALAQIEANKKAFIKEISKRNDYLLMLKEEKESAISKLNDGSPSYIKLAKEISDIDELINSKAMLSHIDTVDVLEKEVLESLRHELLLYHHQMNNNLQALYKKIEEDYASITNVSDLLKLYQNDCMQMAKHYANEVESLYLENKFEDDEYSKVIRDEKIILLFEEFIKLSLFRKEKYQGIKDSLEVKDSDNKQTYDDIKANINLQMEELKNSFDNEMNAIKGKINSLNEDILSLEKQLEALSNLDDTNEDEIRINNLILSKQDKIDYLSTQSAKELEDKYQSSIEKLKKEFNYISLEEENHNKEVLNRQNLIESANNTINESNINDEVNKISQGVNAYLIDLDNLDKIFHNVIKRRNSSIYNEEVVKQRKENLDNLKNKINNLWVLYNKYENVKGTMEEDYENIRVYNNLLLESNYYSKKAKELSVSSDANKFGVRGKIKNLSNHSIYLNNKAKQLEKYSYVREYIELCSKIKQIIDLAQKFESEIFLNESQD